MVLEDETEEDDESGGCGCFQDSKMGCGIPGLEWYWCFVCGLDGNRMDNKYLIKPPCWWGKRE